MKSRLKTTAVSQPSKTIRKRPSGSSSVFRRPKSSKMSYDSMEGPSTASWIASLRASRANLTPSPASAREPQTSDGSGLTSPESSANAAPQWLPSKTCLGCSATQIPIAMLRPDGWKTIQTSLLEEWEAFSGIWPKWGLCLSGECYQLPKWEPATAGRECLFSGWPTPDAGLQVRTNRSDSDGAALRPTLGLAAELWPTSRAEDSESTGAHRGNLDMLTSAMEQWPPPRLKGDNDGAWAESSTRHQGDDLYMSAQQWASPQARDYRSEETVQEYGNSRPLNEQVSRWMTPSDADHKGRTYTYDQHDPSKPRLALEGEALAFSLPVPQIRSGLTFSQRLRVLLPLCRQLRRLLPSPYNKIHSIFKRKLNPDFVDWLMGWPDGWSSADRVYSAAEMESYLSRQRVFLRYLLKDCI